MKNDNSEFTDDKKNNNTRSIPYISIILTVISVIGWSYRIYELYTEMGTRGEILSLIGVILLQINICLIWGFHAVWKLIKKKKNYSNILAFIITSLLMVLAIIAIPLIFGMRLFVDNIIEVIIRFIFN